MEQLNNLEEKEKKELESDINLEEKQRVFELMFQPDQTAEVEFDRINSASSTRVKVIADSDNSTVKRKGKKYAVHDRKTKVERTKFLLQDVLGKCVIPVTTAVLLLLYLIVVVVKC